jgi:uncharacterized protein with NAD-binding domain and iron-sulfur cluster
MSDRVVVIGGGVGGMSAAHELAERGYSVTVLETRPVPGGKARSFPVPQTGTDGRADLPAEHGFRFFPGFYRHLPDTMSRIPFNEQKGGVFANLRDATEAMTVREDGATPLRLPVRFPDSMNDIRDIINDLTKTHLGLTVGDAAHFTERLLVFLTSCEERRLSEWEEQSWWTFSGADQRSAAYQRYLADGLTRTLVAAQAKEISARTGCAILLQLLFDIGLPGKDADRLLNGPTSDVWIGPWHHYLESLGVQFLFDATVTSLVMTGGRVTSVNYEQHGNTANVDGEWFISAIPVERMVPLVSEDLATADPGLAKIDQLVRRWMNGIVFYLRNDVPIVHGHVIYIDSQWSLTSISQRQFWDAPMSSFGDGKIGGILSVDISDWYTKGLLFNKQAMDCSKEEIFQETWSQLKAHLNAPGQPEVLSDDNLISWHLDDDVLAPEINRAAGVREDVNLEPLLVNTKGSWSIRPEATTAVANLMLASDYVRTYTDLATMEGANEAARRCVNAILERTGSDKTPCKIWPLHEPIVFAPAKAIDKLRFDAGHHHELPAESDNS